MDSLNLLKQLNNISPDRIYAERAKADILSAPLPKRLSPLRMVVEILETGSAIVLAGAFMVLILGGFSGFRAFTISGLDPANLHAEADAIDMQIQLADLNYNYVSNVAQKGSTVKSAAAAKLEAVSLAADSTKLAPSNATSSEVGIDDALKALSE